MVVSRPSFRLKTEKEEEEYTRVLHGGENIINYVLRFLYETDSIDACVDYTRPSIAIDFKILKKPFLKAKRKGVRLRYVTEITKENLSYCKKLVPMVDELRHLDGIKGNFYIGNRAYLAPALYHKKGKPAEQIIYSNLKEIVQHQRFVFDSFWNKSISAEQRFREIEEGIEPSTIELITDTRQRVNRAFTLLESAENEILVLFPTVKALRRHLGLDIVSSFMEAERKGVKVRLLFSSLDKTVDGDSTTSTNITPTNDSNKNNTANTEQEEIKEENNIRLLANNSHLDLRTFENVNLQTRIGMLIVDRKKSLMVEFHDDKQDMSYGLVGLAAYSTSKPIALSYASIFESLWKQTELYEQIKNTNERLRIRDKIQQEFINTAAHELKGPIQPILSLSDMLSSGQGEISKYKDLIEVIRRNAKRLHKLTEDILDVARIESQLLHLRKSKFGIHKLMQEVVADSYNDANIGHAISIEYSVKKESGEFNDDINRDIMVYADRTKISEVLSNLVGNAVKFTKSGTITVSAELRENNEVLIEVKDTGRGIDPDIFPRLFSKFATKSAIGGTGLGLYISKNIIERHGGKIWAENNSDGKGAIFRFTLSNH